MNIDELERITGIAFTEYQKQMLELLLTGFDESVQTVCEWLESNEAREFFYKQEKLLTEYYRSSGINRKLDDMIHKRAKHGADIVSELYDFMKKKGTEYGVSPDTVTYSTAERKAMNILADNTYEQIKNASENEVRSIRRQLLEDYINGRHPTVTSLKNLQLKPVNGLSPKERSKLISLTETARAINTASLLTYAEQGVELVELYGRVDKRGSGPCELCKKEMARGPVTINEALKHVIIHPRCRCTWRPVRNKETGLYQKIT